MQSLAILFISMFDEFDEELSGIIYYQDYANSLTNTRENFPKYKHNTSEQNSMKRDITYSCQLSIGYLFGIASPRLTREQIENRLYLYFISKLRIIW